MKNAILINAYPIDEKRKQTLIYQIVNLKKLNLPIILCSGCDLDREIIDHVSYFFVNKEKIFKPKNFFKKSFLEGREQVSCYTLVSPERNLAIFEENVDLTISKNTKLLFEFAKKYNFENVLYTEDDIIVENLNFYKEHLNILNMAFPSVKMCITKCPVEKFLFTCYFFSNVDFFLENFQLPQSVEELDDPKILDVIKPYQIYEKSFTNCFLHKENLIHNLPSQYFHKSVNLSFCYFRQNNINFIIKNHCLFFRDYFKNKTYFMFNNLFNQNLFLRIFKNENLLEKLDIKCGHHIIINNIELNDNIKVEIVDNDKNFYTKTMNYNSDEDITGLVYF